MPDTAAQPHHGSYLMPSLEHATVADAMHPGILSCEPDTSLAKVAAMMATHHVHSIAVMGIADDHSGESVVWGIISDLDLLEAGIGHGEEPTARELARQTVIRVKSEMPLREAVELMLMHHVSHLVVVDPDTQRPTGVLSTLDVAGILAWGEG
jgi:CBS domain-containing protein